METTPTAGGRRRVRGGGADPLLLAVHAATEVEPLWRAVVRLLRATVPCRRVTLFLGHLGMGPARQVLTDPPIVDAEVWFAERAKGNPFSPYIEAHRGLKMYRFREVVGPPARWRASEFYRRFAVPEGWDDGVSVLFWDRAELRAMASLYRARGEPVFGRAELRRLADLHPPLSIAIERVQKLQGERLSRAGLEEFNRSLPVGLLLLGWEGGVIFGNQEAFDVAALWNHGPERARALNSRDCYAMPAELGEVLARVRAEEGRLSGPWVVSGPNALKATVTLLAPSSSRVAQPRFLVVLERGASGGGTADAGRRWQHLRVLTPREREIAILVCEGLSNAEIAGRLGKSVLTIKTQLNSVFGKTGVRSRARLMTLLR